MDKIVYIVVGSILVNNFVLSRFLGICPFLGVSKKVETAFGMGVAVTFVMALSSAVTWIVYNMILVPLTNATGFNYTFLYNIAFILVIATLVQFVEMFMKKSSPTLYSALGVYLPLITTNCAVLGVTVINMNEGYGLLQAVLNGTCAALGFTLTIVLFAGIRERMERNDILPHFIGFPIALITAGLMSVAFFGFSGII